MGREVISKGTMLLQYTYKVSREREGGREWEEEEVINCICGECVQIV